MNTFKIIFIKFYKYIKIIFLSLNSGNYSHIKFDIKSKNNLIHLFKRLEEIYNLLFNYENEVYEFTQNDYQVQLCK
jgi:hypothetical protein